MAALPALSSTLLVLQSRARDFLASDRELGTTELTAAAASSATLLDEASLHATGAERDAARAIREECVVLRRELDTASPFAKPDSALSSARRILALLEQHKDVLGL